MADWIYLDNHTKTRPSKELIEQMTRDETNLWLISPVQKAKGAILELFNANQHEFYLTSSAAESNFQLLYSHYVDQIRETGRTHILVPEGEIRSIDDVAQRLEKFEVQKKILPLNEKGQLTKMALEEAVRARSSLLALSLANPYTGVIQPVHELIEVCKEHDVHLHLDVSVALGKLYLPIEGIDSISFDGRLLHCPGQIGGLIVQRSRSFHMATCGAQHAPYSHYNALKSALLKQEEKIDHYTMEVGRLRDLFEKGLEKLGVRLFFQDVATRLPNTLVAAVEGIHSEALLEELKKQGIFATNGAGKLEEVLKCCRIDPYQAASAVSFALSVETTSEEIERALALIKSIIKDRKARPILFKEEEAKAKNMRLCSAKVGEGLMLELSLLIDEEDGIIADAKAHVFGPSIFEKSATVACDLLIRKNYMQARRTSAELIESKVGKSRGSAPYLNIILEAIDRATEGCMDIPIDDIYVAPPNMEGGQRQEYPGWNSLNDQQRKAVIDQVMETEIQPYVELDAGGVEVVKVEDNRVTIAYSGNCTSCFSATGATLDAIGNILRHKIYPDLMVVPDLSLLSGH